jgi:hypothetical protein
MTKKVELPVDDILSDMFHRLDPKEFKQFMHIIDDFIKRDNPKILDYGDSSKYTRGFRLKPQSSLFYDLGGGEGPIESPNNIVVDDWDGGYEEGEEIHSFIQADLDEFLRAWPNDQVHLHHRVTDAHFWLMHLKFWVRYFFLKSEALRCGHAHVQTENPDCEDRSNTPDQLLCKNLRFECA